MANLRQAAQGHATIKEGFAAMRQKNRELHQEAEFEANVAMGLAQYGFVRDAHKVVDSDPESDGDAPAAAKGTRDEAKAAYTNQPRKLKGGILERPADSFRARIAYYGEGGKHELNTTHIVRAIMMR